MNLKSYIKRLLTMILSASMVFGMLPSNMLTVEAATTAEYISLPITIRDYADDGMLFEFNELARTGNPTDAAIRHGNGVLVAPTYTITGQADVTGGTVKNTAATTSLNGYYTYTTSSATENLVLNYAIDTSSLKYDNRLDDFRYAVITYKYEGNIAPVITLTDSEGKIYTGTVVDGSAVTSTSGTDSGFTRILYDFGENTDVGGIIEELTIDVGVSAGGTAETSNKAAGSFGSNSEMASGVVTSDTNLYTSANKTTELEVYVEVSQVRDTSSTAASSFGSNSETADGVVNSATGVYGLVNGEYVELSAYADVTANREVYTGSASGGNSESADGVVSTSTGVYYDAGNGNYVELHLYCDYTERSWTNWFEKWDYYYVIPGQTAEYTGTKYTANYTYSRNYYYVTSDGTQYTGTTYAATSSTVRNYYYRIPGQTTEYTGALYTGNYTVTGETSSLSIMKVEFFDQTDKEVALFRSNEDKSNLMDYWDTDKTKISYYSTNKNNGNFGLLWSHRISYTDPMTASDAAVYFYNVNTNLMETKTGSGYDPTSGYTTDSKSMMPDTEYYRFGDYNRSGYYTGLNANGYVDVPLSNGVIQELTAGTMRAGLVQPTLGADKKLMYAEDTVDYLAYVLNIGLAGDMFEADGNNIVRRNFAYILGTKVVKDENGYGAMDLATAIRRQLGSDPSAWEPGNYADAKAKFEAGNLNEYTGIATVYDAAYFLLHNLYNDNNGYGTTVDTYSEIQMIQSGTDSVGNPIYIFNTDNAVNYDSANGVLTNKDGTDITAHFDPIKNEGYGVTGSTYIDWTADPNAGEYDTYNFNMTLEGHAKFIYYHDDNLYFKFSGDDDVYLYINDKLVLDLGAAHGETAGRIFLNDVAEICGLEDGEAYDFDFYYMERHGHAAHFSVETNIQIVDPAMLTQKTGYQNGTEVGYNGFIDPAKPVNYSFQLTNNGEAPLKTLEFIDGDIGVTLNSETIILNSETAYTDLLMAIYNADGTVKQHVTKGNLTEATLKAALAEGLAVGERIIIHGFKYTIPESKWLTDSTSDSVYFHNTVQTVGVAHYQNSATETLNGVASYRVQKPTYTYENAHFYTVGQLASGNDKVNLKEASTLTITSDELLKMVQTGKDTDGNSVSATSFDSITICSASGNKEANTNTKAVVNGKTIVYTTPTTGSDVFYFIAKSGEVEYGPIRVNVFNYGWADNVYVLDYSLPVELNGTQFGLTTNDELNVENSYVASTELTVANPTSNYGTFALTTNGSTVETCYNNQSLKYTMTDFMDNVDSVDVTITIKEAGVATPDNRTNGVVMTQKVEVAPASVVYYEDDFAGITYVNSVSDDGTGNVWAEYEAKDADGNSVVGTEQSANQDSNYGSDPNYTVEKVGTLTLNEGELRNSVMAGLTWAKDLVYDNLNDTQKAIVDAVYAEMLKRYGDTLDGTASNGTIHELVLKSGTSNSEIMYFDFKGTGFELISRATQDLYAVLTVKVQEGIPNEDGTFTVGDSNGDGTTTSKVVPVITESEGGDVYEVPIIAIEGLPYSNYKVTLSASATSGDREIYIDGIRIYEPLGTQTNSSGDYLEDVYYGESEAGAEFLEIRPLIVTDKKVVYLDINNGVVTWGTGTTVVEDVGNDETGSTFQVATSDTADYLNIGPNNEIYLDATADDITGGTNASVLAFYVTKDTTVTDAARTLQIGAHRKIDTEQVTNVTDGVSEAEAGAVYFVYGSTAADIADGIVIDGVTTNYLAIESGTEQYITIDPVNLTFDSDGKALILVGTIGGENAAANTLALTNLKINGYTLTACAEEMVNAVNGTSAANNELVATGLSLRRLLAAPVTPDTEVEATPTPEVTPTPEATPTPEVTPSPEATPTPEATPSPEATTTPEVTPSPEVTPTPAVPEEETPVEEEKPVVKMATFSSKSVRSGSTAMLTVVTSENAESILILDADGNEVEFKELSAVKSSDITNKWQLDKLFGKLLGDKLDKFDNVALKTVAFTVNGEAGEEVTYTIYAVDSDGAVSEEGMNVSITVERRKQR